MDALLGLFRPGATIHLPGATGEITALAQALAAEPDRMRGVDVVSCLLPGINRFDYAALHPEARLTVFLPSPALAASRAGGRVRVVPLTYSGIARWLGESIFDVAVAHVAPPDATGRCSFGICADFSPIAWSRARRRVAVVNRAMPAMRRGPTIALAEADLVIESDATPINVAPSSSTPELISIGHAVAALIPDGAAIQLGLGAAPAAVGAALVNHRLLKLRSGLAPECMRTLADAGALADPARHCVGIAAGSSAFYRWLADTDLIAFADTTVTHDIGALASLPRFHAINSAMQIDLFGQANLESVAGRQVSGPGGAPDFAHAALASPGGRSIVALPATAKDGGTSRIVVRLDASTISSARTDYDTVVTEYGVAELRGKSADERAQALIAVAAPGFRDDLARAWSTIR